MVKFVTNPFFRLEFNAEHASGATGITNRNHFRMDADVFKQLAGKGHYESVDRNGILEQNPGKA